LGETKYAREKNSKFPKSRVDPNHPSKEMHVKRSAFLGVQRLGESECASVKIHEARSLEAEEKKWRGMMMVPMVMYTLPAHATCHHLNY
jgi:hypothetical protein